MPFATRTLTAAERDELYAAARQQLAIKAARRLVIVSGQNYDRPASRAEIARTRRILGENAELD
jgi:hypothetical protein